MKTKKKKKETISGVSNGANVLVEANKPYTTSITLEGTAPILFHRYNCEYVKEKSDAKKGSAIKKRDDVEMYVYYTEGKRGKKYLGLPTQNFIAALAYAGKRHRDPSSTRKSAYDMCRAIIVPANELIAPFHGPLETWDFEDTQRVTVQRASLPRTRPGLHPGWRITFEITILEPSLLPPELLYTLAREAGMFQALGDFRPTYGRFHIVNWEVRQD